MSSPLKSNSIKIGVVLLICGVIAYYLGDKEVKKKGYDGLWAFMSLSAENYPKSFDAEPEILSLVIADKPYAKLEELVSNARREGVIPRKGNKFRKAKLNWNGNEHKVELRIKGKLTDHVKDDKWSLRVKVKDGSTILGMSRFSLQHPGTRNYANEWVFHELARKEGLIALRYNFVEVEVNGSDLGVYAMEEHFGQELLEHNGRAPGPILRFDPGLYWQHRLNLMDDVHVLEEYAEFRNANIDAYTEGAVFSDSSLSNSFYKAQSKLEAFRNGKLPVDSVFEMEPLAKYHALIDFVGGHHSLDWSDVKYYYNPEKDLLEPVAYESFSVFPTKLLSGSYRYKGPGVANNDLHNALFNNERFFRAYIKELRRISTPGYAEEFFKDIDEDLQNELAILYGEFPYKAFSNKQYYKNAEAIRTMLDAPQAFHAYLQEIDSADGTITVKIRTGMIESLPVEITGFRTNEKEDISVEQLGLSAQHCILPAKQRRAPIHIRDFEFVLPKGTSFDFDSKSGWRVYYRILGDDHERKVTVLPYAYLPDLSQKANLPSSAKNGKQESLATMLMKNDEWILQPGIWKVDEKITIPQGTTLIAGPNVQIELLEGGGIDVQGRLAFRGDPEDPVRITTTKGSVGLKLCGNRRSLLKNVLLDHQGANAFIEIRGGSLSMANCRAISENGVLIWAFETRLTSNNNVFVLADDAIAYELNATRLISKDDRRDGQGIYITGTWAYAECTSFSADMAGIMLDLDGSEVVIFNPEIEKGERFIATETTRIEFRNLANSSNRLDLQLEDDVLLFVNGKRIMSEELAFQ